MQFKGNAAEAFWGVPDSVYSGRVVRCSIASSGEEVMLSTSLGEDDGMVMFNDKDELDIEMIYTTAVTPPSRGDAFTLGGVTGYVLNVTKNWEYKGWRKITVKATDWKAMA